MKDYFVTTDLLLAAILKTKDFQIEKWEKVNKKLRFYFEKTEELEKVVEDYFATDCYPFKKFWNSLRELKSLIYSYY
jgi:hypothetical protein